MAKAIDYLLERWAAFTLFLGDGRVRIPAECGIMAVCAPYLPNCGFNPFTRLAYHGARTQDQSFNVMLQRDFGRGITPITLAPQDVTRVLLNMFGNGFYAARRRQSMETTPGFEPTLKVATRELGDAVEIRVRDNGIGIPEEVRDKLFQPFFTTKPTGEGTGLGLSITYDIVTQQHAGSIIVDSKVG